jgi:GxxExxY protein
MPEPMDPWTYDILGALMEVHTVMGPGYLERAYQEAAVLEMQDRGIPCEIEVDLPLSYKSRPLTTRYRADMICHGSVLVELKAVESLSAAHKAQTLNYLRGSSLPVGLLVNFAGESLVWRRFVFDWSVNQTRIREIREIPVSPERDASPGAT